MVIHEREGLIARIRHLRRVSAAVDTRPPTATIQSEAERAQALETRVAHLEQLVEGFQDSVHRESQRQSKRMADLENAIQPAVLSAALEKDARQRGL
jgi:hypothetical protein